MELDSTSLDHNWLGFRAYLGTLIIVGMDASLNKRISHVTAYSGVDGGGRRPLTSLYEMIVMYVLCTFVTLRESGVHPLLMASTHFFF